MKNKKIITRFACIFSAAALLLCGCGNGNRANKEKMLKIGVTQIADHPSLDNCREGFIEALRENGYIDGENIDIDFKSAQNDAAVAEQIASTFANGKKDLVCGISTPSAQTLYAACTDKGIPVVFNAISDPVAAKLAVSDTEPSPGISGISDRLPVERQLEFIRELLPEATNVGILYTTSEANSVSTIAEYKRLAPKYGFKIVEKGIGTEAEVSQAIDAILGDVDCISNLTDNTVVNNLALLLQKANDKNIPVFGSEIEQVKNGCMACAGLDYFALGKQAGNMAARVLGGEDISSIPFETIKESTLTVNTAVAARFGVSLDGELAQTAEKTGE